MRVALHTLQYELLGDANHKNTAYHVGLIDVVALRRGRNAKWGERGRAISALKANTFPYFVVSYFSAMCTIWLWWLVVRQHAPNPRFGACLPPWGVGELRGRPWVSGAWEVPPDPFAQHNLNIAVATAVAEQNLNSILWMLCGNCCEKVNFKVEVEYCVTGRIVTVLLFQTDMVEKWGRFPRCDRILHPFSS